MNAFIREVHVVDPKNKRDEIVDLLISGGKIQKIGKHLEVPKGIEIIEGKNKHLIPGLIDLHTHFREPGFESKETILTGSMAALKGGFVASVSMPNTQPACDNQGVIDLIVRKSKEVPYHIFPTGTISKGREGQELTEMADLKKVGIVGVTDDGDWVADSLLMRRAMEYASMLNLLVMSHCEDKRLSAKGVMNEGLSSTKLGLLGISSASEDTAVARDIELARLTGARLHICHLSTGRSVELVRRAKEEKLNVTAEVTPHHLALSDETIEGYNTNFKMNPPLRSLEDVKALRQGLKEGVIDCIATDHAPHTQEEKMHEFDHAPFGVIGLETALGVVLTELYYGEKWDLKKIIQVMSVRPAEIIGLGPEFGGLEIGQEANLALMDLNQEWTVEDSELRSKSKNSCFMHKKMKGRVTATICAGKMWKF